MTSTQRTPPDWLDQVVGIYHADGGMRGELAYLARKIMGSGHCSLCDITHGNLREKDAFRQCRIEFPVELTTLHRNEQPAALRAFTRDRTPCVVGRDRRGQWVWLLGPAELEACQGDVDAFARALERALNAAAPTPSAT